jgi:hypothetical protein
MKASVGIFAAGGLVAVGLIIAGAAGSATKPPPLTHVAGPIMGVAADPVAPLYGHVALVTSKGKTEKLWLSPNHTFQWQGPMGERGHGTWMIRGSQICLMALTEADPQGRPRERTTPAPARCAPFQSHKAGEDWNQSNDRGEFVHVHVG